MVRSSNRTEDRFDVVGNTFSVNKTARMLISACGCVSGSGVVLYLHLLYPPSRCAHWHVVQAWAVSALLEVQASLKVLNVDGDTPLHLAAQYNKVEAATLLIAAGADITATNMDSKTPLQLARTKKMRGLFD